MSPAWLRCSLQPFDRGMKSPRFPYSRYAPIQTKADCSRVIQDEARSWSGSFRGMLTDQLCKLICLLNQSHAFETTHTVVGSHDPKTIAGYEWARACVGASVTLMFRKKAARFEESGHVALVKTLCDVLSSTSLSGDATGWLVGIWPEVIMYENQRGGADIRGYGVELRVSAFGHTDEACSKSLSDLLQWITEVILAASQQQARYDVR